VISIAAPIVIAETLLADVAGRAWLGERAFRAVIVWLALVSVVGLAGFGFLAFRDVGYDHPPASYLIALAIAVALVRYALRPARQRPASDEPVPSLWRLRAFAFAMTVAAFAIGWIGPHVVPIAALTVLALAAVAGYAARRIAAWSTRSGWGPAQRLALASGALGFLIALAPVIELGAHTPGKDPAGQIVVAAIAAAGLVLLARRAPTVDAALVTAEAAPS
jgi:hypothetical protein